MDEVKRLNESLVKAQEEIDRMGAMNQTFETISYRNENFRVTTQEPIKLVEGIIKQVYKGMILLHNTIFPLTRIQKEFKGRGILIKRAFSATKYLYEWSRKYIDSLEALPRYDRMTTNRDKARFGMTMQSHVKLTKDIATVLHGYLLRLSQFDALVEEYKISSIGMMEVIRPKEEV